MPTRRTLLTKTEVIKAIADAYDKVFDGEYLHITVASEKTREITDESFIFQFDVED